MEGNNKLAKDDIKDKILLLNIKQSYPELGVDQAVKEAWKVDLQRVKEVKYICAVYQNIIIETFERDEGTVWYDVQGTQGRRGFYGHPVDSFYKNKDVSNLVDWKKGRNPVRYLPKRK